MNAILRLPPVVFFSDSNSLRSPNTEKSRGDISLLSESNETSRFFPDKNIGTESGMHTNGMMKYKNEASSCLSATAFISPANRVYIPKDRKNIPTTDR